MKAIWKIESYGKTYWYSTLKEATKSFYDGTKESTAVITRVPIGCYINPDQLILFIKENFKENI